jgi:hypothetical protein
MDLGADPWSYIMDFVELLYSGSKHIWLEKVEPKMFFVCLEPLIGAVINKTLKASGV